MIARMNTKLIARQPTSTNKSAMQNLAILNSPSERSLELHDDKSRKEVLAKNHFISSRITGM